MKKLDMHTPDLVQRNIEQIAALFPEVITEIRDEEGNLKKGIDFDLLKQQLSPVLVEDENERYRLDWPGKKASLLKANTPINKTLRPVPGDSVDFETTENLYIEGDNFEVLKLLQEPYLGKIKMIYIDPPYNTGNDFIYKDNFSMTSDEFDEISGAISEEGGKLFKNTDSNGHFHSDWLGMIYEKLLIAKDLLAPNGIIFISIDDNEFSNLRKTCDEVFGELNFIDTICWKKKYGGGAKEKFLVSVHEYVLLYAKDITSLPEIMVHFDLEKAQRFYRYKDENFERLGYYRTHPLEAVKSFDIRPNLSFPVRAPDGTDVFPKRQWRWGRERFEDAFKRGEVIFTKNKDGGWTLYSKQYLNDENGDERKTKAQSLIDDVFTQEGTKEIVDLFGDAKVFPFPKPSRLILKLIEIAGLQKNEIILDFFSGSATTAHAVLQLNAEDGGNRRFIMVQLPEKTDEKSEAYKAGYKTIAEIGKERIRRAAAKIKAETIAELQADLEKLNKKLEQTALDGNVELLAQKEQLETKLKHVQNMDYGFRVFRTDSTNMKDVFYHPTEVSQAQLGNLISNIKEDRTPDDLLAQVMLDLGLMLSLPVKKVSHGANTVFYVAVNSLVACFDENISFDLIDTIAGCQPLRVVFRESGFKDDKDKINVVERFKRLSPETTVRVL